MGRRRPGSRTTRNPISQWILSGLVLLVLCDGLAGADGEPGAAPPRGPTAAESRSQVMDLAAKGKLTDRLIARFRDYAWRRAIESPGNDVPKAFWTWAGANPAIRSGLILALHPDDNPHIVKRLWELKQTFGDKVDDYAQLALAFAVVFGRAGDKPPWAHVTDYTKEYLRNDRTPPTMIESFGYYLKYRKLMRFPLRKTPWPMLVYVADNETPMAERLWVLKHYAKRPDKHLARVYREVPWKMDKVRGKWALGDLPRTLENLREYGGVCAEQSYFASRVYKSLGVPAFVETGVLGMRGYHATASWIGYRTKRRARDKEGYLLSGVGTGLGGTLTELRVSSKIYSPVLLKMVGAGEVQLLVATLRHSWPRHVEAEVGCAIYGMLDAEQARKTQLLKDSIERSPFCARAWRLLAQACVDGVLTEKQAEDILERMIGVLEGTPLLTFEVLEKVLTPRLAVTRDVPRDRVRRNLRILDRAVVFYDRLKQNELGIRIVLLKGDYLVRLDRPAEACKLYMHAAEQYVRRHTGFVKLFDRALALMKGEENAARRLRFLDRIANRLGVPPAEIFCGPGADAYTHVLRTYIDALRDAGKDKPADEWEARLRKMQVL